MSVFLFMYLYITHVLNVLTASVPSRVKIKSTEQLEGDAAIRLPWPRSSAGSSVSFQSYPPSPRALSLSLALPSGCHQMPLLPDSLQNCDDRKSWFALELNTSRTEASLAGGIEHRHLSYLCPEVWARYQFQFGEGALPERLDLIKTYIGKTDFEKELLTCWVKKTEGFLCTELNRLFRSTSSRWICDNACFIKLCFLERSKIVTFNTVSECFYISFELHFGGDNGWTVQSILEKTW